MCRLKESKLAGFFPQNFNVRSGLQPSPARISEWLDEVALKINEKLKYCCAFAYDPSHVKATLIDFFGSIEDYSRLAVNESSLFTWNK